MSPPGPQRQELKRKRVVDRAVDEEDLKNKKKARKEEKRRARQAEKDIRDAAPNSQSARAKTPPQDGQPRSRTPTKGSQRRRRRSSHTAALSNSDRKGLQHEAKQNNHPDLNPRQSSQDVAVVDGEGSGQPKVNGQPSRLSKKQQKEQRRVGEIRRPDEDVETSRSSKQKKKKSKNKAKHEGTSRNPYSLTETTWRLSDPFGGRYANSPPVFSRDERHILLATEHQLGSYSTDSSLLEHYFPSETSGDVLSYTLSQSENANVYIGTRKGYVVSWDRAKGKRLGRWMISTPIWSLACGKLEGSTQDTVFTIDQSGQQWNITAHRFGIDGDPSKTELATMLKHAKSIRSLHVTRDCKAIVAMTPDSLLIGRLASGAKQALKNIEYVWREVPCKEPPTCLDVQASRRAQDPSKTDANDVDVVYGGLQGSIFHYQNIFSKLTMTERPTKHVVGKRSVDAPRLHWHREAVGAVAFSRDGSYIISGGSETVLVLWQLDTGRKQFLPHLESPVVELTISPSGAFYAVGLGDNSIMILSTAELKPTANYAGLQSPCTSMLPPHQMMLPTKELLEQMASGRASSAVSAVVHPQELNSLLCAVPAAQSTRAEIFPANPSTPYLQTYSLSGPSTSRHIARQALSRTNATNINLGPDGNKLHDSSITHLAISQNGQWLATVDEWAPPRQDLEDLLVQDTDFEEESINQRQVTLRFWKWSEPENAADGPGAWQLNTRVDTPHTIDGTRLAGRVLALDSCPSSSGFATVGEDNTVRLWSPKTRVPNGQLFWREGAPQNAKQQVSMSKRAQAKTQTWWAARQRVPLSLPASDETLTRLDPDRATLAYSNDGSLIAVHVHHKTVSNALVPAEAAADSPAPDYDDPTNTLIHFVDADYGTVRELRSDLCPSMPSAQADAPHAAPADGVHALAFLDYKLVALTRRAAYVWDVTSFTLLAAIPLPSAAPDGPNAQPHPTPPPPFLAINPQTRTFALSAPVPARGPDREQTARHALPPHPHRDFRSSLAVYAVPARASAAPPAPVYASTTARLTLALLNAAGSGAPPPPPAARRAADLHSEGAELARRALASGFHVLDCAATLRTLRPPLAAGALPRGPARARSPSPADERADGALARLARHDGGVLTRDDEEKKEEDENVQGVERRARDAPVVSAEQLAAVFEPAGERTSGAGRMPSVREMFDGVMALFAGKPEARGAAKEDE